MSYMSPSKQTLLERRALQKDITPIYYSGVNTESQTWDLASESHSSVLSTMAYAIHALIENMMFDERRFGGLVSTLDSRLKAPGSIT